MIPTLIHIVWFDYGKGCVPYGKFKDNLDKIHKLHPKWRIYVWKEESVESLLRHINDPHVTKIYKDLQYKVSQNDFARLLILREFGGFYTDLDVEMTQPFDVNMLPKHTTIGFPNETRYGVRTGFTNCMIAAQKGSLWLSEFIVDSIKNPPKQHPEWMKQLVVVLFAYGPFRLSKYSWKHKQGLARIDPARWPGVHRCASSWAYTNARRGY
jgi:hypothetical protein